MWTIIAPASVAGAPVMSRRASSARLSSVASASSQVPPSRMICETGSCMLSVEAATPRCTQSPRPRRRAGRPQARMYPPHRRPSCPDPADRALVAIVALARRWATGSSTTLPRPTKNCCRRAFARAWSRSAVVISTRSPSVYTTTRAPCPNAGRTAKLDREGHAAVVLKQDAAARRERISLGRHYSISEQSRPMMPCASLTVMYCSRED